MISIPASSAAPCYGATLVCMDTVVRLGDDVAVALARLAEQTGRSLEETANDVLRRRLATPKEPDVPFQVQARPMKLRPGLSYDKPWRLLESAEERRP